MIVPRRTRAALVATVSLLALAACAGRTPPPSIRYDSDDFRPAAVTPEPPRPVEIVEVPKPLPLPGQLLPPPGQPEPDDRPPEARVAAANAAATREPTRHGYLNAIQVHPYTPGALYRLYTAPERISDIALQPGETLVSVAAGDTVRWVIGDTTSGTGPDRRVHVLVKPFAPGQGRSLAICPNHRVWADRRIPLARRAGRWAAIRPGHQHGHHHRPPRLPPDPGQHGRHRHGRPVLDLSGRPDPGPAPPQCRRRGGPARWRTA